MVSQFSAHVADDGQLGEHLQDLEPDPDVLRALRHRPPRLAYKLLCVQPDLNPVVEQGEQRGEGEGGHEDGNEPELEHCKQRQSTDKPRKIYWEGLGEMDWKWKVGRHNFAKNDSYWRGRLHHNSVWCRRNNWSTITVFAAENSNIGKMAVSAVLLISTELPTNVKCSPRTHLQIFLEQTLVLHQLVVLLYLWHPDTAEFRLWTTKPIRQEFYF